MALALLFLLHLSLLVHQVEVLLAELLFVVQSVVVLRERGEVRAYFSESGDEGAVLVVEQGVGGEVEGRDQLGVGVDVDHEVLHFFLCRLLLLSFLHFLLLFLLIFIKVIFVVLVRLHFVISVKREVASFFVYNYFLLHLLYLRIFEVVLFKRVLLGLAEENVGLLLFK